MNKTQVKAYYSLFGDHFDPNEVTSKLEFTPTSITRKGDIINAKHSHPETSWTLSTEYEESLDVNEQLNKVMNVLKDKVDEINTIQVQNQLKSKFFIVIVMEDGYTPALYFDSNFIKFADSIHAEIDVDLYANPYSADTV
ncbi:DUF4279 domain-containing protein [Paenibacillus sp. ACRSA]|uniref:DUF4279 domain-containing protein n=1 Tax=Paenibacillus sp. ACRSA TaxID=2918211 RepID=UPI001EF58CB6|nr:DUF4279 domain-containing protein [Paenibacillus sp. ACRSA]MCG7376764.1 DUF4279 domain-containing protein [Paenibacillus sp. ACRSA]